MLQNLNIIDIFVFCVHRDVQYTIHGSSINHKCKFATDTLRSLSRKCIVQIERSEQNDTENDIF